MKQIQEPQISIKDLFFKYAGRKKEALSSINIKVHSGETILLLGPSGSGKSTFSLCLNGLIPQRINGKFEGEVQTSEMNTKTAQISDLTQEVGILFQDPESQFVMMNVEDEIAFGLENLCFEKKEINTRIVEALKIINMSDYRYRKLDELSGGEKQLIAIACLLAMRPKILVFDEPTANLDPVGTRQVFAVIEKLRSQKNHIIIIVEHKLDDLMTLIDRVIILSKSGSVFADGTPNAIFNDNAATLLDLGVWMPQTALLAHELRLLGHNIKTLPLTVAQAKMTLGPLLSNLKLKHTQKIIKNTNHLPNVIETIDLSYHYKKNSVLNKLNIIIKQGDFLAVIGSNGAGKTTFSHLIAGIIKPKHGRILLNNTDLSGIKQRALLKQIGFVFQNPEHQFITDSVQNEVRYGLKILGLSPDEVESKTTELLDKFDLLHFAKANPFQLSHGEKRRLSVATMLAMGQKILILDEPTFGQDQKNSLSLMNILKRLNDEGHTIIMITHDMSLVAQYALSVAVINKGSLCFHGPTNDLFSQPNILKDANLSLPPLIELFQSVQNKNIDSISLFTPSYYFPDAALNPIKKIGEKL